MVFFHWYRRARSLPSTMQPPGNRMKPGCRSASACTMSARRPPGRFFQVCCGKERDEVNVHRALAVNEHVQSRLRVGVLGCSTAVILLPVGGERSQPHRVEQRAVARKAQCAARECRTRSGFARRNCRPRPGARPCRESLRWRRRTGPCPRIRGAGNGGCAALKGFSSRMDNWPRALLGESLLQPIMGSGNSKPRFFTSSAYSPPSAPKLMSSKKIPHIAGLNAAPGLSTWISMVAALVAVERVSMPARSEEWNVSFKRL